MSDIGIIILAAGKSIRMGQPKQLLKVGKNSLIQHVVKVAGRTPYSPIVVVLGSHFEKIKKEIAAYEVTAVFNQNWENGMGTSIAKGITAIQKLDPNLEAVFILLVDQPLLKVNLLSKMVKTFRHSDKKIVSSQYDQAFGVPALFDKTTFIELESLEGDKGAKKVIQKFVEKGEVAFIDFPEGRFDLDTNDDYQHFLRNFKKK